MFDLSVFTTYAILYKQSGTLTSGRQPSPTPTPVDKKTDINAEPTISKAPTPTKAPAKEEKAPTKAPAKTESTSEPKQTAQKTPTKAPPKTAVSPSVPQRDRTPQTGDSYNAEPYFAMLAAGSTLAGFGLWIGRRKK